MRARKAMPLRRRLKIYAGILFLLLASAIVFDARTFIESRSFYFPVREEFPTPPGATDVAITTPDGLTLHGWFIPASDRKPGDPPGPAIVHVHGNAGHIGWHLDYSHFLTRAGFSVLIFDYRGFGRSDLPHRRLQRDDLLIDALAAIDFLAERPEVDPERIGVFGVSLGGVLGLAAAAERPRVRTVVSVAAFSSWRRIAGHHGTPLGLVAVKPGLDATTSIGAIGSRPVLLVHGSQDTIVPISHVERLESAAKAAGVRVRVLRTGSGHNEIVIEDPASQSEIAEFLKDAIGADPPEGGF